MNFQGQIGKKNKESGQILDLTYICPRIIGMSFPAEGLEISSRNNINDVVSFLKQRHGDDFHIYNISGCTYDVNKFDRQVSEFAWEDLHSIPIHILFQLCKHIAEFLEAKISNVISIHCLTGKGRTGTAICCYLLYCGRFDNAEDVLFYYAKKRFQKGGGVMQPSQRRFVTYFAKLLLKSWKITPTPKFIVSLSLGGIPAFQQNNSCRPYIEIYNVKENKFKLIYTDKTEKYKQQRKYTALNNLGLNIIIIQIMTPFVVIGDVMIKVYQHGKFENEPMFRFTFNTAFLEGNNIRFELNQLDPQKIKKDTRFPPNFYVQINLKDYCKCSNQVPFNQKCKDCRVFMHQVRAEWETIHSVMKNYQKQSIEESKILLFGDPDFDDFDELLYSKDTPFQFKEGEQDEDDE